MKEFKKPTFEGHFEDVTDENGEPLSRFICDNVEPTYPRKSLPITEWANHIRKLYLTGVSGFSNTRDDALRIAGLHSWYKHLTDDEIMYPLILQGEEERYAFDPRLQDPNQENLHFRFLHLGDLKNLKVVMPDGEPSRLPGEIIEFVQKYPIHMVKCFSGTDIDACVEQAGKMLMDLLKMV